MGLFYPLRELQLHVTQPSLSGQLSSCQRHDWYVRYVCGSRIQSLRCNSGGPLLRSHHHCKLQPQPRFTFMLMCRRPQSHLDCCHHRVNHTSETLGKWFTLTQALSQFIWWEFTCWGYRSLRRSTRDVVFVTSMQNLSFKKKRSGAQMNFPRCNHASWLLKDGYWKCFFKL